jgi:hypothetical protein
VLLGPHAVHLLLPRRHQSPLSERRSSINGPAVDLRFHEAYLIQHPQERPLANRTGNSV